MKPFQDQTYYELLEVPVTASEGEIRAAYERAQELYGPDSVAIYALEDPGQADDLRARLREAMEILTDVDLREEYDRSLGLPHRANGKDERALSEREPAPVAAVEAPATTPSAEASAPEPPPADVLPGIKEPPQPRTEPDPAPVREAVSLAPVAEPAPPGEPERPSGEVRAPAEASPGEPPPPASGREIPPPSAPPPPAEATPPAPPRAIEPPLPASRAPEPPRAPGAPRPVEPPRPVERPRSPVRPSRGMEATKIAEESAIAAAEAAMAQVSARVREVPRPAKPIELPPDVEFNGELLRRVRESRGTTLAQVAERTRISMRHLENVEADRYQALPAVVYLRGILMSMAREYGLDAIRVSKSYLALAGKKS